jgi:hypothetical protein
VIDYRATLYGYSTVPYPRIITNWTEPFGNRRFFVWTQPSEGFPWSAGGEFIDPAFPKWPYGYDVVPYVGQV